MTTAGNPSIAIDAISQAVQSLGTVQGIVGAGENTLNYAINLAQSQITSFTSAESQIRDANVAQEAANLSQAQVMQQASIAAMAQANQEPQAILKLLQG
jgi:flagellin